MGYSKHCNNLIYLCGRKTFLKIRELEHFVFFLFQLDDCALQLSHNGAYLDLESTLAEQKDELEGFQEDSG